MNVVAAPAPADFRERLRAALLRAGNGERLEGQRTQLEREYRDQLAALEAGYLQLSRRTVTALIGGTVAIGGAAVLLSPWLNAAFGAHNLAVVTVFGRILGLSIGASANHGRGAAMTL